MLRPIILAASGLLAVSWATPPYSTVDPVTSSPCDPPVFDSESDNFAKSESQLLLELAQLIKTPAGTAPPGAGTAEKAQFDFFIQILQKCRALEEFGRIGVVKEHPQPNVVLRREEEEVLEDLPEGDDLSNDFGRLLLISEDHAHTESCRPGGACGVEGMFEGSSVATTEDPGGAGSGENLRR